MAFSEDFSSYVCARDLDGHKDSVNALAFSCDGRYLASGGDDCVLFIFESLTGRTVHKVNCGNPVTALLWDPQQSDRLFAGLGDGRAFVVQIAQKDVDVEGHFIPRDAEGPVEAFASESRGGVVRLVICAGCTIEVWDRSGYGNKSVWDRRHVRLPSEVLANPRNSAHEVLPRSAHILHDGQDLAVSFLNHGIVCWDLPSRAYKWHILPRTARIGRSTMSSRNLLAVSNLYDGFDLYDVVQREHIRTYEVELTVNLPLPVLLAADESELISGSSSGEVRIFDPTAAHELQVLDHDGAIIQALAYCDAQEGFRLLATGSSETGPRTLIKVWQKNLSSLHTNTIAPTPASQEAVRESNLLPGPGSAHGSALTSISPLDTAPRRARRMPARPVYPLNHRSHAFPSPTLPQIVFVLSGCALLGIMWLTALTRAHAGGSDAIIYGGLSVRAQWSATALRVCALLQDLASGVVWGLKGMLYVPIYCLQGLGRLFVYCTVVIALYTIELLSRYLHLVGGGGIAGM